MTASSKKLENKNFISEGIPQDRYMNVSVSCAQANNAYWMVMKNMFRESAALGIQRQWRKKHGKEFKGTYKEKVKIPNTMRFIQEPIRIKKALEHAEKIKAGSQLELDLKDPEFIRNIYKAFRLELISTNELVDTLLLFTMKELFTQPVRKYSFEEKGPFNPRNISFGNEELVNKFYDEVKKLPHHESYYYSVNFSLQGTAFLLFFGLWMYRKEKSINKIYKFDSNFLIYLKKYIENYFISDDADKLELLDSIDLLNKSDSKEIAFIENKVMEVIYENNLTTLFEMDENFNLTFPEDKKSFIDSIKLFIGTWRVSEDMPGLELSPDYNKNDPKSPLICFNLLSVSAFNILQLVFFDDEHIVPFFTVGQISTRFMRELDEKPSQHEVQRASRPVELVQSDVIRSKDFHGYESRDFFGIWHDLFFHTWKCSLFPFHDLTRYLAQFEEKETGFEMSKTIWSLVDKDFVSIKIRTAFAEGNLLKVKISITKVIEAIINRVGIQFFDATPKHDINLLYIIDMIINATEWQKKQCGLHPRFRHGLHRKYKYDENKLFVDTYDKLEEIIIDDYQKSGRFKCNIFYILAFRLQTIENSDEILNKLNKFGMQKIFFWKRNKGLFFNLNNKSDKSIEVESITPELLYDLLCRVDLLNDCGQTSISQAFFSVSDKQESKETYTLPVDKIFSKLRPIINYPCFKEFMIGTGFYHLLLLSDICINNLVSAIKENLVSNNDLEFLSNNHYEVIFSDAGLSGLREQLYTLEQLKPFHASQLKLILTEIGLQKLRQGVFTLEEMKSLSDAEITTKINSTIQLKL